MIEACWINIEGIYVNLATAIMVMEYGPQGTEGYKIDFGGNGSYEFRLPKDKSQSRDPEEFDRLTRIATRIRFWLYARQIPHTGGSGREEG